MGERLLAHPRDARALGGTVCCEHFLSAKGSKKVFGRGKSISKALSMLRSVSVRVWVDAPLTTRVTLNMMHFDGQEVGRSAKRFEMPHNLSTHLLMSAKGSRDASLRVRVENTRACSVFAVVTCTGRGRATPGPHRARDGAFG